MSGDKTKTSFTYRQAEIRADGERLNLTDMWKAEGAVESRQPAQWLRSAESKRFMEFLAETLILRDSQDEGNQGLIKVVRGGSAPYTEAHWLIGMAYAKYLSPEFHVWCNTVVRDRMEGKLVPAQSAILAEQDIERLKAETKQIIAPIVEGLTALNERVDRLERNSPQRRPITPKTKKTLVGVIMTLGRRCPCCGLVDVLNEAGEVVEAEFDHFFSNQLPSEKHAWLICKPCHRALTDGVLDRNEADSHFVSFQRRMDKILGE